MSETDVDYFGAEIDEVLTVKFPNEWMKKPVYGTGEEPTVAILDAFKSLDKQIRNLDGLPLKVKLCRGVSPVFRASEVFPQLPVTTLATKEKFGVFGSKGRTSEMSCPPLVQTHTVILKLESSSKWPGDLRAITYLIVAFNIKLAQLLREEYGLVCEAFPKHVDVLKDGYMFRLKIASLHEVRALKRARGMIGTTAINEAEALSYLAVVLPKVTTALYGIQMQYLSYGATCRLAKRWVAAHLLADHVPDICIDLIVAQVYLSPYPYTSPSCPQVGLLRFLQLLVSHDWRNNPLIVNLSDKLKKEDYRKIVDIFYEKRESLPLMCITTPYDDYTSCWSRHIPTLQILQRLILLASETTKELDRQYFASTLKLEFKTAFRPPLEPYDVLIHLLKHEVPTTFMNMDVGKSSRRSLTIFKTGDPQKKITHLPVLDFNPALLYLSELKEAFNDFALFFYDPYGGDCIYVLWKPSAFQQKLFKIADIYGMEISSAANEKEVVITPNVLAIVENFKIMGKGLVDKIETRTNQWQIS